MTSAVGGGLRNPSSPRTGGQQELLLRAALLRGRGAEEAWRALSPSLDLDKLPVDSIHLLPVLYRNLLSLGVDDPRMPRLKGVYRGTWYKNQIVWQQVAAALRILKDAGIVTILLRSPALVVQYYQDFGLRTIDDFEIVAPSGQIATAARMLKYLERQSPTGALRSRLRRSVMTYMVPGWESADRDFWDTAVEIRIDGVATRALNPTDQLLYLWVQELRFPLGRTARWAADSMMILERAGGGIDWTRLIAQARRFGAGLPVKEAAAYLAQGLEAPIPPTALKALQDLPAGAREAFAHRLSTWTAARALGGFPSRLAHYMRLSAGWSLPRTLLQLPRFLQNAYGLEHTWQIPLWGARRGLRRLRRRGVT